METASKATKPKRKNTNRYVVLLVLCLCEMMFLLPYLRWTFYDSMIEAFSFTNTQLASLGSVYGAVALLGYALGGPLCDHISPRKLLISAYALTAASGFWFATFPSFEICVVISIIWGIATALLLWDCMIRVTRTLGSSEEQGKFFGLLEGGRGAVDTISSFLLVAFFAYLGSTVASLQQIIIILSALNIVGAVLVWIFIDDTIPGSDPNDKINLHDLGTVLKNPAVWLIALVIVANYSIYTGGTYLTPYLTDIVGISAAAAAVIAVFRNYFLMMFGGPIGGFLGDRFSITKVIVICFAIIGVSMLVFVLVPASAAVTISIVVMMILYLGLFLQRGIYFGTVDQARIPLKVTGTAVGVISFIGFIPEVYMNSIAGELLDNYPGATGYHYLFIIMLVFAVIGLVVSLLLMRNIKKTKALKAAGATSEQKAECAKAASGEKDARAQADAATDPNANTNA